MICIMLKQLTSTLLLFTLKIRDLCLYWGFSSSTRR